MPEPEYAVKFENLTKAYHMGSQTVHALRGVTASIEKGGFWAIMGASGSGKSTMLNILGCLDRPTSGSYFLGGKDVSGLDSDELSDVRLKYIGFIFQSFNLIPQLTVSENIALPLYYQGIDEERGAEIAEKFAAVVKLENRLGHKPAELSGGQQQRVAIARALATDPVMILADEPTGNLDSATSIEIMELLAEMNRGGKTIIMVTHEPDIAAFAKHRIIMKDGYIDRME
jgi:ABC-type antimicrobial peptide transport system, ATPase component